MTWEGHLFGPKGSFRICNGHFLHNKRHFTIGEPLPWNKAAFP